MEWKIEDSKVWTEGQMKHVLRAWTILQRTNILGTLKVKYQSKNSLYALKMVDNVL